jgi:hypothetical protein
MTKHSKRAAARSHPLDLSHGPRRIPQNLLRRYCQDAGDEAIARFQQRIALQKEAAKYRTILQNAGAKGLGQGAEAKRALVGLQRITERIAARKVVAPKVDSLEPGILAGSFTKIYTPPYQWNYQRASALSGKPVVSASADMSTGKLKNVAVCNMKNPSQAYAESDIGIYFTPTFNRGVVTVTVNPSLEYSWWINSRIESAVAASQGGFSLGFTFYYPWELGLSKLLRKAPPPFADLWGEILMGQLDFGFGSIPGYPLQISFPVSGEYIYLVIFGSDAQAQAEGWPNSLAGGNLAITVPSFTLDVQPFPEIR